MKEITRVMYAQITDIYEVEDDVEFIMDDADNAEILKERLDADDVILVQPTQYFPFDGEDLLRNAQIRGEI